MKIGEMIFRDLLHTTSSMIRVREMVDKVEKQWKQDKTKSKIKQSNIMELEHKIVELRGNPQDMNIVQSLLKENDT